MIADNVFAWWYRVSHLSYPGETAAVRVSGAVGDPRLSRELPTPSILGQSV